MSGRPWYKRYPADFIHATMMLTLEQKGAYGIALDLMYENGGPIADDPKWLARVCGCSMQQWRKIRRQLIDIGKLSVTAEGLLSNGRMMREMLKQRDEGDVLSAAGKRGGTRTQAKKRAKNAANHPESMTSVASDRHPFAPENDAVDKNRPVFDYEVMKNKHLDQDGLEIDAAGIARVPNADRTKKPTGNRPTKLAKTSPVFEAKSRKINEVTSRTIQADSETQIVESPVSSESSTYHRTNLTHPARARVSDVATIDSTPPRPTPNWVPRVYAAPDAVPRVADPPGWTDWWAAYPPCGSKPFSARLAYERALREASPGELLDGLRQYAFCQGGPRWIIRPENWLRDQCWKSNNPDPHFDPGAAAAMRAAGITPEMLERDRIEKQRRREQASPLALTGGVS